MIICSRIKQLRDLLICCLMWVKLNSRCNRRNLVGAQRKGRMYKWWESVILASLCFVRLVSIFVVSAGPICVLIARLSATHVSTFYARIVIVLAQRRRKEEMGNFESREIIINF